MSNQTDFVISRGEFKADCLPATAEFMQQNLKFFHSTMSEISATLGDGGDMIMVSNEEHWNFATKITRTELGHIVEAKGKLIESGRCRFDEAVADLNA